MKIEGRRIKIDFEKGRNDDSWYPKRLNGGKGGRVDKNDRKERQKIVEEYEQGKYDGKFDKEQLKLDVLNDIEEHKAKQLIPKVKSENNENVHGNKKTKKKYIKEESTDGEESHHSKSNSRNRRKVSKISNKHRYR